VLLAASAGPAQARTASVAISVIAADACAPRLREVVAEQLADLATGLTWSCFESIDEEAPFRAARVPAGGVQMWIDVSLPAEARLTVRDHEERFVVRRVPLASGLDEVGREEIGQIVRSAVLAVLAGASETLSRAEARVTVSSWPGRPGPVTERSAGPPVQDPGRFLVPTSPHPAPRGAAAGWRPTLDLGAVATLRAFSSPIPVVGEFGVVAVVGGATRASLWVEAAYRLPASERAPAIGVEIRALSLRAGFAVSSRGGGRVAFRAGAGAGIERTSFSPQPTGGGVALAPGGSFLVVTGRALIGVELRVTARLRVGLTAFCDAETTNVHYDLHAPDGTASRVLTPFPLQPGLTLSVSGRFGS